MSYTIIILFQNSVNNSLKVYQCNENQAKAKQLQKLFFVMKLLQLRNKVKKQGAILIYFSVATSVPDMLKGKLTNDFFQWLLLRYEASRETMTIELGRQPISSFSSMKRISTVKYRSIYTNISVPRY